MTYFEIACKEAEKEKKVPIVKLWLARRNGDVYLRGNNGDEGMSGWDVARITTEGKLERCSHMRIEGLSTDVNGRIHIQN